ncbi:MAG: hypothetical protein RL291_1266, partial [Pseudomonadota bacterium]
RAIGASGVSAETADSIKALVDVRLSRKFSDLDVVLDLSAFKFEPSSAKTLAVEEGLVAPLKAMAPVCGPQRAQ